MDIFFILKAIVLFYGIIELIWFPINLIRFLLCFFGLNKDNIETSLTYVKSGVIRMFAVLIVYQFYILIKNLHNYFA